MGAPIILFVIGALFGLHILINILQDKDTPKISVILHGIVNAIGLGLVIVGAVRLGDGLLTASMIGFIIAALGGFYLAHIDIVRKQRPPKPFAIVHPAIAVISLILLIFYVAK